MFLEHDCWHVCLPGPQAGRCHHIAARLTIMSGGCVALPIPLPASNRALSRRGNFASATAPGWLANVDPNPVAADMTEHRLGSLPNPVCCLSRCAYLVATTWCHRASQLGSRGNPVAILAWRLWWSRNLSRNQSPRNARCPPPCDTTSDFR
jgi:hypothetical protein